MKYDKNLCKRNRGIYTFRVQGQVYHFINEMLPSNNEPSYLQLYFYDTEHELEHRIQSSTKMSLLTLHKIIDILHVNPYCRFFRNHRGVSDLDNYKILIRSDVEVDQRLYNSPSVSQVAAVWVDDAPSRERKSRDIVVYGHAGFSHKVEYYFGCYDPLQYPLLFPHGESGWHRRIQRVGKNNKKTHCPGESLNVLDQVASPTELLENESAKKQRKNEVSCQEYYCYKLQIRPIETSVLLHAGRLLQQYVVDMYVKLETSRLDYFRNQQDAICAELYQGIIDSIEVGEDRGSRVVRRVILPSSFIGGPRDIKKKIYGCNGIGSTIWKTRHFPYNDM